MKRQQRIAFRQDELARRRRGQRIKSARKDAETRSALRRGDNGGSDEILFDVERILRDIAKQIGE